MKRIVLLFAALAAATLTVMAGERNEDWMNFRSSRDGRIYWQRIFDTELTRPDIIHCLTVPEYTDRMGIVWTERIDSTLAGTFRRKLDYRKYEVAENYAPIFVTKGICGYVVRIDVRDGRYRVTISGIRFDTYEFSNSFNRSVFGLAGGQVREDWHDLESLIFKENGKPRGYVLPYLVPMLDQMWTDEYTCSPPEDDIIPDVW